MAPLSPAMADSSPAEGSVLGTKTQILYRYIYIFMIQSKKFQKQKNLCCLWQARWGWELWEQSDHSGASANEVLRKDKSVT